MAIKFDHSQDSLNLAIGIDDERSDELDAIVFFKKKSRAYGGWEEDK